jgi:hypothetical protein
MNDTGRIHRAFEWLMAALAILVIPALIMERRAPTPEMRTAALVLNWVIWLAFVIEFVVRWIADGRRSFPRRAWFDVFLIAVTPPIGVPDSVQGFRTLRALRVLRLFRAFGVIAMWSIVTATTVGYGDVSPISAEGRLIAVILMLTGIGVIGVFTATVASFFFENEQQSDSAELAVTLDRIEHKLDELLSEPGDWRSFSVVVEPASVERPTTPSLVSTLSLRIRRSVPLSTARRRMSCRPRSSPSRGCRRHNRIASTRATIT